MRSLPIPRGDCVSEDRVVYILELVDGLLDPGGLNSGLLVEVLFKANVPCTESRDISESPSLSFFT